MEPRLPDPRGWVDRAARLTRVAPHALMLGGTGMLAGVSLWLAEQGYSVSVVARGRPGLDRLARQAGARGGAVHPVTVDYREGDVLRSSLLAAITDRGPAELAVCWIHAAAPEAIWTVADVLGVGGRTARLIHVRGSASADPSVPDPAVAARMATLTGLSYEVVALGYAVEAGASRWLTDDEIVAGVVGAIREPAPLTVVGVAEPWSSRP